MRRLLHGGARLCVDIDRRALEVARRAEYGRYSFRGVSEEERAEHFEPVGTDAWRVRR